MDPQQARKSPHAGTCKTRVVLQHTWRPAGRYRGRPGADPGSHRLLHHRGRRPQGRPLCLLLYRRGHRLRRRPPRHDLRRHRRHGAADGDPGQGAWPAVSAGGDPAHRPLPDSGGLPEARQPDAVCLPLRGHRLRQCAGHPHLYGPAARAHQRHLAGLRHDGGRPWHHLSVPAHPRGGQAGALPAALHRHTDGGGHHHGDRYSHRGRHGRAARYPAHLPVARGAAQSRDPGHHLPLLCGSGRGGSARIHDDGGHRR
ncbi:hypothetical protein D3C80_1038770 [compost metagenome]